MNHKPWNKRILKRILILFLVFVGFVVLFSFLMSRKDKIVTAQISQPSFPTVSFQVGENTIDTLNGYASEMDIASLRDDIVATGGTHELTAVITVYKNSITAVDFTIYSIDGTTVYETGNASLGSESAGTITAGLQFDDSWRGQREAVLCLTVERGNKSPVYYYTRITRSSDLFTEDCVDFALKFSNSTRDSGQSSWVQSYLESNASGDNTSFRQVTMNSSIDQVMWSGLILANASEPEISVKESNSTFTSLVITYSVDVTGNGSSDKYRVREFYRVRGSSAGFYLLNYVRTMSFSLQDNGNTLTKAGIDLGISDPDVSCLYSSDGNIVTFVADDALWQYNKSSSVMQKIFTFRLNDGSDERADYSSFSICPVHMSDTGDISFTVTGYMNRGLFEGRTGAAVYFYSAESNTVTLKAFVPSSSGSEITQAVLDTPIYFSQTQNAVYALLSDTFYRLDITTGEITTVVSGVTKDECAFSGDSSYIAWPSGSDAGSSKTAVVLDMETGETQEISSPDDSAIKPLGFIGSDFVYGLMRSSDAGQDSIGTSMTPMYAIRIVDAGGNVLKEYMRENTFISNAEIAGSMVTVYLDARDGTVYTNVGTDYITSNADTSKVAVTVDTYTDSIMKKCVRITLTGGISNTELSWSAPEYAITENTNELDRTNEDMGSKFYVYGGGRLAGVYNTAAAAITAADSLSGVVVGGKGQYIWERGNRDLVYAVEGITASTVSGEGSALSACLQMILMKEGSAGDAAADLNSGNTAAQVLEKELNAQALNLSGLTVEQLCYIIDQNTPVIAMTGDGNAVLIVGYDKSGISYIDPQSGAENYIGYTDTASLFTGGNIFIGYSVR